MNLVYFLSVTGTDEQAEVETVITQLSCHKRTCMKFQAGVDHKFFRAKASPSYDRSGVYIKSQLLLVKRLHFNVHNLIMCGYVPWRCETNNWPAWILPILVFESSQRWVDTKQKCANKAFREGMIVSVLKVIIEHCFPTFLFCWNGWIEPGILGLNWFSGFLLIYL